MPVAVISTRISVDPQDVLLDARRLGRVAASGLPPSKILKKGFSTRVDNRLAGAAKRGLLARDNRVGKYEIIPDELGERSSIFIPTSSRRLLRCRCHKFKRAK